MLIFILPVLVVGNIPVVAAVGPPKTWSGIADLHAYIGRERGQGSRLCVAVPLQMSPTH